ncbi:MAG: 4-hydroxy-tetrahydrodipicolinate reductase [Kiritimatiellae bacterium]|jgi:4-hydroxy-tetrahydrodipicolinate reductase|nr:4-hydroxy-tetrahydrodipicolinate reductase [Kiritimatiellia bacterium]MDD4342253.1 4-hydroxy-tetrahydrodipicolinate reductase [Kiritimatiellia bacterium]MDY0149966.1 4-hydroxy-tetrahydrodipicolinate reductase [Kiritimatiellia bacterium]
MSASSPLHLILMGAGGRMGQAIIRLVAAAPPPGFRVVAALDHPESPLIGQDAGTAAGSAALDVPITADLDAALRQGGDVAIDFSQASASVAAAPRMAAASIPWVVGTTGLDDDGVAAITAAAQHIPVILAANMSPGINLLYALIEQAARALRGNGYDCEIVERHHRRKKDAPSGTALFLGRAAAAGYDWTLKDVAVDGRSGLPGERPTEQIGFHAVRGGDIAGDHSVIFAADGECIELSHRATSRDVFAIGALRAAAWLAGRPAALYGMRDVLGLTPGGDS